MNEKLKAVKSAMAAAFMALGTFLGWKGIMLLAWVGVMGLDYLSGSAAACKEGKWSSAVARTGLWHKGGMIIVVAVAAIADGVLGIICGQTPIGLEWPGVILPLVLAWYILTELGSILENAMKLGVRVPKWLTQFMSAVRHLVDDAADKVTDVGDTAADLPDIE